ncbi:hypothetical protein JHK85_018503 [Glycine max]|nr:hypothetical protein JHK85_018503 [Glycine max]
MSLQGSASGNGTVAAASTASLRLRLNPNKEHKPDGYEDMQLDFSPNIFSSLERYLPPSMLNVTRDEKAKFMREILLKYLPLGERNRAQKHREYRERIIANYQPLHLELYSVDPATFFVPTFLRAINDNTEQSYRSIVSEPFPGIFIFDIFQTHFCELLLSEIENFEKWVTETKFRIMHPNTMNKFGAVLDDFGLETMLDKLMEGFIRPLSREVGGSTLDSHHGFVVEYGKDRDVDLGFHVDDSEVTLNVCLGKQFSGGELFFRGVRCEKHVNTGSHSEQKALTPSVPQIASCPPWLYTFESRRSLIILMSLDEPSFIVVVIAMVLELQHLVIGSTYFYGAEGDFTCCLISLLLQFV